MEFYYDCAEAHRDMRGVGLDQRISGLVSEWSRLSEQCRTEFGECSVPLSEQQLRERIRREIAELLIIQAAGAVSRDWARDQEVDGLLDEVLRLPPSGVSLAAIVIGARR